MTDSSCHEPGNGRPVCVQLDRIEALETDRGEIARDIATTRQIATRTLDEVVALRGEMRESEARRDRDCEIRHRPVERRLDRLETHEDTLDASSAVTYSPEALIRRYEEIKAELVSATGAKRTAEGDLEIARLRARQALWGALAGVVVAVASAVVALLESIGE